MNNKLKLLLNNILKDLDIYFYTIDNLFNKIIIFSGSYILEVSTVDLGGYIKKGDTLFFYLRKFDDINKIYNFINEKEKILNNKKTSLLIQKILIYEKLIYSLFKKQNELFFESTFNKIITNKNILFILKGGGMEETIEKSFIAYCNYSKIKTTVLYKFGKGYWGQQINQDGFINELKINNTKIDFIYKEDFDDDYIDSIIDNNTEVFSFQYNYKGKYSNINMLVLSSVSSENIDCLKYKNIFSCYQSNTVGYSTDKFINKDKTNIYKIFNPQNIILLNNYSIIKNIDNYIISGGMSWARDFSILNSLNGKYKGIIISDEVHNVENFISMFRGIQSYYGFFGVFKLSQIGVFCHLEEYNNDDRSKMIATSICSGIPVIVAHNDGIIVKTILDNKLGVSYINGDKKDLLEKVRFFTENRDNIIEYGKRCREYSNKNMDINKFINFIFEKTFS